MQKANSPWPPRMASTCSSRPMTRIRSTLRQIHDPPGVLFRRGTFLPQDELAIAIVGTRHATRYGLAQAERLAAGLARVGFTIASGLRAASTRPPIAARSKPAAAPSRCLAADS